MILCFFKEWKWDECRGRAWRVLGQLRAAHVPQSLVVTAVKPPTAPPCPPPLRQRQQKRLEWIRQRWACFQYKLFHYYSVEKYVHININNHRTYPPPPSVYDRYERNDMCCMADFSVGWGNIFELWTRKQVATTSRDVGRFKGASSSMLSSNQFFCRHFNIIYYLFHLFSHRVILFIQQWIRLWWQTIIRILYVYDNIHQSADRG